MQWRSLKQEAAAGGLNLKNLKFISLLFNWVRLLEANWKFIRMTKRRPLEIMHRRWAIILKPMNGYRLACLLTTSSFL